MPIWHLANSTARLLAKLCFFGLIIGIHILYYHAYNYKGMGLNVCVCFVNSERAFSEHNHRWHNKVT